MTNADRLQRWNAWYERTPELWRFQIVVWALVIVGAINMLLTIAVGFPFALLVGVAVAAIAAIRVPYALGWVKAEGDAGGASMEIDAPSWVYGVNRWYDGLEDTQRLFVLLAAFAIPGAINMLLTFAGGFPFGLLFLLAVLAVVAVRAPYAAGWLKEKPEDGAAAISVAPRAPRIGDEASTPSPARASSDGAPVLVGKPRDSKSRSGAAGEQSPESAP